MNDEFEYEIHFAAEYTPSASRLREQLYSLGFEDDPLKFKGVVYSGTLADGRSSCPILDTHVTWSTFDRILYLNQLSEFEELLSQYAEHIEGYTHAEVIRPEWDVDFALKPFNPSSDWKLRKFRFCENSSRKLWDIHISTELSSLDKRLAKILHSDMGLYYIDLEKQSGTYRIFTLQGTDSVPEARTLFFNLVANLRSLGGFAGSVKFEQTTYWQVLGKPKILPPRLVGNPCGYIDAGTS